MISHARGMGEGDSEGQQERERVQEKTEELEEREKKHRCMYIHNNVKIIIIITTLIIVVELVEVIISDVKQIHSRQSNCDPWKAAKQQSLSR